MKAQQARQVKDGFLSFSGKFLFKKKKKKRKMSVHFCTTGSLMVTRTPPQHLPSLKSRLRRKRLWSDSTYLLQQTCNNPPLFDKANVSFLGKVELLCRTYVPSKYISTAFAAAGLELRVCTDAHVAVLLCSWEFSLSLLLSLLLLWTQTAVVASQKDKKKKEVK